MNNQLEAIFAGGPLDGELLLLETARPELKGGTKAQQKEGGFQKPFKGKYKLVSKGPPLRYMFAD
jgi:hypothetical protein